MSMVGWANKNARAMGKLGLYAAGGVTIGYPLVDFATKVFNNVPVDQAAEQAIGAGYGVNVRTGYINKDAVKNGIIRTGLGAGMILLARKL